MKLQISKTAATILASGVFLAAQSASVFAQGSLTPPGAPAPTMKSLDQIEPRIPVNASTTPGDSAALFVITNSGSYYLTTNLTGASLKYGIRIAASDVVLDLNGFAVTGVNNSFSGVFVSIGAYNVRVRHGTIRNWGQHGIDAILVQNGAFEDLVLFGNGTAGPLSGFGLDGGTNSLIRNCQAWGNSFFGIGTEKGGLITDCLSRSNALFGIGVGSGGVVRGCVSSFNLYDGIQAADNCLVVDNNAHGNRGGGTKAGILVVFSGGTRVENNNVSGNDYGISVSGDGNFIVRNSAHGNFTSNYNIGGTQTIGPIVSTTGIITTNNPWANFSY